MTNAQLIVTLQVLISLFQAWFVKDKCEKDQPLSYINKACIFVGRFEESCRPEYVEV